LLKQRVITALILAPLVLWGVLSMPNDYLAILFGAIVLVGGREWARLSGIRPLHWQLGFILLLALVMALLKLLLHSVGGMLWLLLISTFWWLVVIWRLAGFQGGRCLSGFNLYQMLEGLVVLAPAWLALTEIHRLPEDGPFLLVFLLLLIWSADISAYFAGRAWGRVKLAPKVSPGKTREGVYGALVGALICGLVLAWWQAGQLTGQFLALLLCLITALFSVAGDLFESLIKRQRGLKDSGSLLPGHGGMLDRIDSLTAAAPVFLLGLILLGEPV
jgi:phosphatidate cytidylyltransferase